jgi:hypothetical protein
MSLLGRVPARLFGHTSDTGVGSNFHPLWGEAEAS